ncbi:monovalent cation/H+ antiporter complex subunit F [Brachybacterium sp. GCM10030267]|uniref:monovalent cation/H+ antiporter complex subunit F n=1 Tax=unclassified Brachybacterium TaxID=2623841 RepID=UPI0036133760
MTIVLWLTTAMLGATILVGLFRMATAPDPASRAVVGDLVFFSGVGVIIIVGLIKESAAAVDAALIAAVLGILSTVALARILTRGQR